MKRRARGGAWALAVAAALSATGGAARAAELGGGDGDVALDVHGFMSEGAILSTGNNYLAKSKRGSLEFAEVGLNFTSQLTDRLRVGLQLFTLDLGPQGNYRMRADWFYLDYRWRDWFGIRAGRVKLPFGLYNETSDIDAARVAILLPQSVYPVSNRDFLLAQTGVEIYGYVDLRAAGALEYRLYGGTIYVDITANSGVKAIDVPYVAGGRAMWETPVPGLRLGGSVQALRLTVQFLPMTAAAAAAPASASLSALLGIGSAEFVHDNLTLAAEFAQWRVAVDAADLVFFPPGAKRVTVSERRYVSATYHAARWFWPGAYYSLLFPDEATATFSGASQNMTHDFAGSLRFDVNAHWLVKLEGHFMHGTAGLDSTLNDNRPLDALTRNWAVFLAKTTAYF
jgi:hypothetical protein